MDTGTQDADHELARIRAVADEHGLHTVRVGGVDIDGIWRGKQLPMADFLRSGWRDGMHMCSAVLAVTVADELVPGLSYTNPDGGYPDVHLVPDLTTFARVPWVEGTASVICDFVEPDGSPVTVSARHVLRDVLARAREQGFEPKIGYELEFYLFGEPWPSAEEKGFANLTPLSPGLRTYSLSRLGRVEPILGDIVRSLIAAGVPVEGANTEYSPSQFELNLHAGGAVDTADHVVRFKAGVREIAESHGTTATFMAKYAADRGGSSGHIHQSLWDANGGNVFAADAGGELSATGRQYAAGLLATMADCTALLCPTINSYKRLSPWSFAPTTATWGDDNRTCGLRVVSGSEAVARVEHRLPGADANPYLAIATCLAGGLYGIEHELDPAPFITGSGYDIDDETLRLPSTLDEALARLENSKIARELLSEDFIEHFLATRQAEVVAHRAAVTDWERRRYFELI